ncbi:hypothetical protein JW926_06930 [Candidatus Sumerlaeota bacterium]|nr:hypothetical protein [Candidatus Sumerlaeota bacterium]
MKNRTRLIWRLVLAFCVILPFAECQPSNPFAPTAAMDTMSEGSVTGGMQSTQYIDRMRDVGIAPSPQRRETKEGSYEEFGAYDMGFEPDMSRMRGRGSSQQSMATPVPTPKQIRVLTGSRVQCAVSGEILEDIIYRDVPEWEKDNFYDDGTHGDTEAGDGTYTNITVRNDVMSPSSHLVLQRLLTLMENIEGMEPMDFYRLNVVTSEPLSSLPKQIDEEQDRDMKMSEWNDRFLRMFRVRENDPLSEFYPLYVPPPPAHPNVPLPAGFQPVIKATPTPETGGMMGYGVAGEGAGGHMGNYYRRGQGSSMGEFEEGRF